jgi:hypothetical protein
VFEIYKNNGYSDAHLKEEEEEEMNKIAHVFLQSCFQIPKKREVCFQGAK